MSDPSRPSGPRSYPSFVLTRLAVLAVGIGVGYLTRPLWHGFVYAAAYSPPALVLFGGATLVALGLLFLPPPKVRSVELDQYEDAMGIPLGGSAGTKLAIFGTVVLVLVGVALLVAVPTGALEERTLAQETMDDAIELEEFPQANPEQPRVVPREVADVTTRGSVSYRQHRLGTSDIARYNGSLTWSYAIEPEGPRNKLFEHQQGVMFADMTSMDQRTEGPYEQAFEYGEGMYLSRSADWQLKATDFWAQYHDDPIEFVHDGEPYMAYPKTGHEWRLTPIPHTVPTWEGVALVSTDGTIEHLSPEEAQESEVLDGQRLYPLYNTDREMASLEYRNGIVNQLSVVGAHEDQVEVADLPEGAGNTQPFVIDLAGERMSYVTAMEPYGADTRGLDEVWFADAETGEYTYFGTGTELSLTGPERAMGIARSEDSRTNWGENFVVTEPVPVTVDGDLWWHVKVTPIDATDVTRNVFVAADGGEAVELHTDEAVREFVRGEVAIGDLEEIDEEEETDDEPEVVYYIVVTDEDGEEIERIPVERGQDASIVAPDDEEEDGNSSTRERLYTG